MNSVMLTTFGWLLVEVAVFWVSLIFLFAAAYGRGILQSNLDRSDLMEDKKKLREGQKRELEIIDNDLRTLTTTRVATSQTPAAGNPIELLEQGVALNQTLAQEDNDAEDLGDHWLSGYRWLWFAAYQLIFGFPIAAILVLLVGSAIAASTGFGVTLICLCIFSPIIVGEKKRAGVDRFGRWVSFLGPGLQFRVPIIETATEVSLKNMVWGPGQNDQDDPAESDEFHLGGISGVKNPSPGKFKVLFHATYEGDVEVIITLRVRRSHRSAWYWWAYEFSNPNEIGEQIAAVSQGILTTRAREIDETETNGDTEDTPAKVRMSKRMQRFLNAVPEITGDILKALHQLSQDRLGGILPISVVITSVSPPEKFTNLLLKLDTAAVDREVEQLAGMATADRLEQLYGGKDADLTSAEKTDRRNYDIGIRVAESGNVIDTLGKAFVLPLMNQLGSGKSNDGPQKK